MTTKTVLKTYFETNDTPDQDAFYEWMDSYWHKEDLIPAESLDINLNTTFAPISNLKYGTQNPPNLTELTNLAIKRGDYYVQTSNGSSTGTEVQRALFNGVQLTEWTVTTAVWNGLSAEQKNAVKIINVMP
ncbi:hypothetical protein [Epilithonimonas sp. UC225_85]|uniref:hypothetical protein n=1 Tax=Epilithonimonas sp. UC225_85 TaxID=3350167 RepID=UPI0036D22430